MKAALLINPGARQNRGDMFSRLKSAAQNAKISIFEITDFAMLGEIIDQIHALAPDLLITSGGDGTVHGVLSIMGEDKRFAASMPLLALLPHGTTNITAKDISLKSPHPDQLQRILQMARTGELTKNTITRHTLRIENLVNRPPQHGFIFGAGAVAKATKKCQLESNAKGWTGNAAIAKMLIGDILAKLIGRDPSLGGVLTTQDMSLTPQNGGLLQGETLTIFATTLNNLFLSANPFWNQGENPIHITRIGNFTGNFYLALYRILYGDKSKLSPEHFQSFSDDGFELGVNSNIVIDGEFYAANQDVPLKITAGPKLQFLRF